MNNNSLEIQKFLDSVQTEVEKSGEECDSVLFSDFWNRKYSANDMAFDSRAFLCDVTLLEQNNQIAYYQELTSYKKGIAKVVKFSKRIIRKLVAFLFLPIIQSQNEVNSSVTRLALHLRAYVNRDNSQINKFMQREKELEMQVKSQRDTIKDLSKQLEDLKTRLENIENGRK